MAIIREYQTPVDRLVPNEEAISRFQQSGYRIKSDYRLAGEEIGTGLAAAGEAVGKRVNDYLTQQGISSAASHGAAFEQHYHQEWTDFAKSHPNDPNAGQEFLSKVFEPALETYQSGYTSTDKVRMFALERADAMRNDMYHVVAADMSTMAGDAVINNVNNLENSTSSLLYKNPELLASKLAQIPNMVDAFVKNSPNLSVKDAAAVRDKVSVKLGESWAKSAFLGLADRNPRLAEEELNAGKFGQYLNGAEAHRYIKMAEETQKAEARAAKAASLVNQRLAIISTEKSLVESLHVDPKTGAVVVPSGWNKTVLSHASTLGAAGTMRLLNIGHTLTQRTLSNEASTYDPHTYTTLLNHAATGDLNMVDAGTALAHGYITGKQFTQLKGVNTAVNESPQRKADWAAYKTAVAGFKGYIDTTNLMLGKLDAHGAQRYSEFLTDTHEQFQAGLDQGWSAESMVKPGGAHYLFGDVKRYEVGNGLPLGLTVPKQLQGLVGNEQPLPPPSPGGSSTASGPEGVPMPQLGESPSDYTKRIMEWSKEHGG